VDDKEENFNGFKGTPILYDAPHNRNVSGYIRLMNMKEVKEFFMQQEECNREK
jgi:5'(3')-deoxyribonucleotidase